MHIARIDQFLKVITDVTTLIVTARLQFACRHFVITDVEKQKGLNWIDFQYPDPFEFVFYNVQQQAV